MKRLLLILSWFPATILFVFGCLYLYSHHTQKIYAKLDIKTELQKALPKSNNYKMYAALPKTLGISTTSIETGDALPELIYRYLESYKSPMVESTDSFISIFRNTQIDPIIPLAIAQCESNLGKKMPKVSEDSDEICLNPFGLGIHSRGKLCFETWEDSYEKMARVLKTDYLDKGYISIDEIMAKYCPLSIEKGGTWAICVKQFKEEIETLKIRKNF